MAILTVTIAALLVMTSAESIERRRPFHRRGSTTTTSYPLTIDNEGSESNFKLRGKDPFSAKDSTPVTKIIGDSSSGNFKLEGNKLTVSMMKTSLCSSIVIYFFIFSMTVVLRVHIW